MHDAADDLVGHLAGAAVVAVGHHPDLRDEVQVRQRRPVAGDVQALWLSFTRLPDDRLLVGLVTGGVAVSADDGRTWTYSTEA